MDYSLGSRLKHAWNAFLNRSPTEYNSLGFSSGFRPDRSHLIRGGDKTIISSIYNRIAMDVSAIDIRHVRLDNNGRFSDYVNSGLDTCLTLEANIDQTGRYLIQDAVLTMLDKGVVAIVPVDTNLDPKNTQSIDILSMRAGEITNWYPQHITVRLYNDRKGTKEEITIPKKNVAIVENPMYSIMNSPNSTLQRLLRKLSLMDVIDENNSSGKLDLIIQLPYAVRTETRRAQADQRRREIVDQLTGSKYGIAYTDATENITQLNRAVENNLMSQVEYLTSMLYGQLGLTQEIMNGTADEHVMLNYNNRTIEPIVAAFADEFKRKFLTKTARTQGQSIEYYRDPFRLVPVSQIAEIADKFTRNEIMTSNEIRQIVGMRPSDDPKADELRNKNLSQSNEEIAAKEGNLAQGEEGMEIQNGFDDFLQNLKE